MIIAKVFLFFCVLGSVNCFDYYEEEIYYDEENVADTKAISANSTLLVESTNIFSSPESSANVFSYSESTSTETSTTLPTTSTSTSTSTTSTTNRQTYRDGEQTIRLSTTTTTTTPTTSRIRGGKTQKGDSGKTRVRNKEKQGNSTQNGDAGDSHEVRVRWRAEKRNDSQIPPPINEQQPQVLNCSCQAQVEMIKQLIENNKDLASALRDVTRKGGKRKMTTTSTTTPPSTPTSTTNQVFSIGDEELEDAWFLEAEATTTTIRIERDHPNPYGPVILNSLFFKRFTLLKNAFLLSFEFL
jgi:hypothetical protein